MARLTHGRIEQEAGMSSEHMTPRNKDPAEHKEE